MTFLPNSPESLDGFLFGQMAEDMNGNLYIATEHGRLNCLDRTTQKVKRYDPVLSRIPFSNNQVCLV